MLLNFQRLIFFVSIIPFANILHSQNTDSLINQLKSTGKDSNKVNTLNILAKAFENSNSKKSFEFINDAISLSESINYKKGEAKAYLNKGNYYFHKADYNTAREAYSTALLINKEINYLSGVASAYTGIGLVDTYIGDYKNAIENYFKGLEIKEKNGHLEGQAILLSNIGELYMYQNQYENSLKYHSKSLEIEKKIKNEQGVAESYSNIAGIYFYMNRLDLALDYFNLTISVAKKLGDLGLQARSLNNIGCIFEAKNENEKAITYLTESMLLRQQIGDKNGMASTYQALGKAYQKLKKYKEAISNTEKSIKISEEIDAKKTSMENYTQLGQIYEDIREFEKGLINFHKAEVLKDSISSKELSETIVEKETKYQTDKKEKEIKLLTQENKIQDLELNKNRITIYATAIVILLLIILAATILKRYQLKQKANKIITEQKALVDQKQKEIVDSINYAKRIQYTLIAHADFLNEHLKDYFVFYKPKDIVSGDFYWAAKKRDSFYLAVCDSTGHGVPGAFMSLLNIGFLSEAINEKNLEHPHEILNYVRQRLITNISKEDQQDGFDGILLRINTTTNEKTYAASYNHPIIIEGDKVIELPADKMPVGKGERNNSFTLHSLNANNGAMLYLFTDGYADQFGGPVGKKFKYKQLNALLQNISNLTTQNQNKTISETFENWKGDLEQIDDVCMVGIRL